MGEKKIVVPEGMLKAVLVCTEGKFFSTLDSMVSQYLEAALRWLSDNPIVPTEEQWNQACDTVSERYQKQMGPSFSFHFSEACAEWQRRMFLAPEPEIGPVARRIVESLRGVTLTPQDADRIVEELACVAHGWTASVQPQRE